MVWLKQGFDKIRTNLKWHIFATVLLSKVTITDEIVKYSSFIYKNQEVKITLSSCLHTNRRKIRMVSAYCSFDETTRDIFLDFFLYFLALLLHL